MVVLSMVCIAFALGMLFQVQGQEQPAYGQSPNGLVLDGANSDLTDAMFAKEQGPVGIGITGHNPLDVPSAVTISDPNAPRMLLSRTDTDPILWNFEAGQFVQSNGFAIADLTNLTQKLIIEPGPAGKVIIPSGVLNARGNVQISNPGAPRMLLERTETNPILWNFEAGEFVSGNGFAIADLTNLVQKFVIESGASGRVILPQGNLNLGGASAKITSDGEICIGSCP